MNVWCASGIGNGPDGTEPVIAFGVRSDCAKPLKPGVERARVVATRAGEADEMTVRVEGEGLDATVLEAAVREVFRLSGAVEVVAPGALPRDGVVIEDQRSYD